MEGRPSGDTAQRGRRVSEQCGCACETVQWMRVAATTCARNVKKEDTQPWPGCRISQWRRGLREDERRGRAGETHSSPWSAIQLMSVSAATLQPCAMGVCSDCVRSRGGRCLLVRSRCMLHSAVVSVGCPALTAPCRSAVSGSCEWMSLPECWLRKAIYDGSSAEVWYNAAQHTSALPRQNTSVPTCRRSSEGSSSAHRLPTHLQPTSSARTAKNRHTEARWEGGRK